jgi:hypothetical protein
MDDPPREVDTAEAIDRAVPAGGNTGLERKQAGGAGLLRLSSRPVWRWGRRAARR